MTVKKGNLLEFVIIAPITSASTTFDMVVAPKFKRADYSSSNTGAYYDLNFDNDATISLPSFRGTFEKRSGAGVGQTEVFSVSSVTALTASSDGRRQYRCTFEIADDVSTKMRGLKQNDDGTNAIANVDTDLAIDSLSVGDSMKIAWDVAGINELESLFVAGSTKSSAITGEAISKNNAVAINSIDSKLYNFDSDVATHNLVGIASDDYLIAVSGKYILSGGASVGHTGLTQGKQQYASDTIDGAITETPTDYPVGHTDSTGTIIYVFISLPPTIPAGEHQLTQAEAQNTSSTVFGVVTGQRLGQSISANTTIVKTSGTQTITGIKTFTSSPIVPTPTTSTQVANKAYVDNTSSVSITSLGSWTGNLTTVYQSTIPIPPLIDDYDEIRMTIKFNSGSINKFVSMRVNNNAGSYYKRVGYGTTTSWSLHTSYNIGKTYKFEVQNTKTALSLFSQESTNLAERVNYRFTDLNPSGNFWIKVNSTALNITIKMVGIKY